MWQSETNHVPNRDKDDELLREAAIDTHSSIVPAILGYGAGEGVSGRANRTARCVSRCALFFE